MATLGNSFGKTLKKFGGSKNIWHEVKAHYPVGGKITNLASFNGDVIPAGSMCKYDQAKAEITIVKASEIKTAVGGGSVEPKTIKGLLMYDVQVDADMTEQFATGAVVYAGEIYIDRVAEAIPAEVLAVLPMIVPINEK